MRRDEEEMHLSDKRLQVHQGVILEPDLTEVGITGYKQSLSRNCLAWIGYLLSGFILRLAFFWYPKWYIWATHKKTTLDMADKILVKDQYHQYSIHSVMLTTPDGTRVAMVNRRGDKLSFLDNERVHQSRPSERTPLKHDASGDSGLIRFFFYKKLKYVWDRAENRFELLRGFDDTTCSQIHASLPLDSNAVLRGRSLYSENVIDVPITPLLSLLFNEALNPFYIFQVFSCILWYIDDYWVYASCIVFISLLSLTIQLYDMRKNERSLRDTVCSNGTVYVSRQDQNSVEFSEVDASDIVPGDILEIPRSGCTMFCDAVLLSGNCIVNESMLTGESVPVTKTPLPYTRPETATAAAGPSSTGPGQSDEKFHVKAHSRHVLFCGTRVIQTRYYAGETVRAVVIRTGFLTAKGDMVRSILFPKPMFFKFNQDAMKFILVLAGFALIGFGYTVYVMLKRGFHIGKIVVRALDLVTIVVPPALPVAMTVGIVFAQRRLKRKNIFCISPNSINVGGIIDVVCFDKTGTLTEDGLDLWGVVSGDKGIFDPPESDPHRLPRGPLLEAMATCHSLTRIEGELSGDPLDLKMFYSIKWEFTEEVSDDYNKFEMAVPTIVRPAEPDLIPVRDIDMAVEKDIPYEVGIIRQFPFSSSLQRMSVIARVLGAPHFSLYLKGSPELVETLCRPDTVPSNFHSVLLTYTREGYRVLALAWRPLKVSYVKALRVTRDQVETSLHFLGLLVMENRLKPETTPIINVLRNANIRPLMVTGDNMLTALSVARDCEMIDEQDRVILVTASVPPILDVPDSNYRHEIEVEFHYAEDLQKKVTEVCTSRPNNKHQKDSYLSIRMIDRPDFHLAMTGKTWGIIRTHCPQLIPKLVVKGTVFARFSPDQKAQLVEALQTVGYLTGMCGDGANDCGALKAAHTGISLSEAEASVASPFTSRNQNISCVPELIKEGRCALATSFATFKFMAGYSLTQFISVLLLYWVGLNLTDWEFLYIDLIVITTLGITLSYTTSYPHLSVERPSGRLISVATILSLVLQMGLIISFQTFAFLYIQHQPWFIPHKVNLEENDFACVENTSVFLVSSFQYIILAIVFSKGPPFRKHMYTNYIFVVNIILLIALGIYISIHPFQWLKDLLEIVDFPRLEPRMILLGCVFINFFLAYLFEAFVETIAFRRQVKRLKTALFPRYFRQKEYETIRDEIQRSTPAWPPLVRSASIHDMKIILSEATTTHDLRRSTSVQPNLEIISGDEETDDMTSVVLGSKLTSPK